MLLRVLTVDDERGIRDSITRAIKSAALACRDFVEFSQARTATGAVKILKKGGVDLAIVDYDLGGGLTGVQLIERLLQVCHGPFICLISGKDEAVVDTALDDAFGRTAHSVHFRAKPLTIAECKNIYGLARKQILNGSDDFLFADLLFEYGRAKSAHERVRLLNLACERAARVALAVLSSRHASLVESFLREQRGRPFISASAFLDLAGKVSASAGISSGTLKIGGVNYFTYIEDTLGRKLVPAARFVLERENDSKHRAHMPEIQMRAALKANEQHVQNAFEFIADLRAIHFFRKEDGPGYGNTYTRYGRGLAAIETLGVDESVIPFQSGAIINGEWINLLPLILFDRCDSCGRDHAFQLVKTTIRERVYLGPCSREAWKVIRLA